MRNYFLLFFTLIPTSSFSQSDSTVQKEVNSSSDSIKLDLDVEEIHIGTLTRDVSFPGGYANYINRKIGKYIDKKELKKIPSGTRIFFSVIITKNGLVKEVKVIKTCETCIKVEEALTNLLLDMKGWDPAISDSGKAVNRKIAIPVIF